MENIEALLREMIGLQKETLSLLKGEVTPEPKPEIPKGEYDIYIPLKHEDATRYFSSEEALKKVLISGLEREHNETDLSGVFDFVNSIGNLGNGGNFYPTYKVGNRLYKFDIYVLKPQSKPTPEPIPVEKELVMITLGDSFAGGNVDDTPTSTTISPDTLYQWRDVQIVTGTKSTGFYGKWAEKLKELTGRKLLIINLTKGTSAYAHPEPDRNWGENGTLYAEKKTIVKEFQDKTGKKVDLIFLQVGGMDYMYKHNIGEVAKQMDWLVSQLKNDFPDAKILLSKIPIPASEDARAASIVAEQQRIIDENPEVFEMYDYSHFYHLPKSETTIDGLHPTQEYNDVIGTENGIITANLL